MDSLISNDEVIVGKRGKLTDPGSTTSDKTEPESCSIEFFKEKDMVISMIREVITEGNIPDSRALRMKLLTITAIIERYREDPSLLDPHVVDILRPIFADVLLPQVTSPNPAWSPFLSLLCSLVYTLSSICGYSSLTLNEVFPHDVSLLAKVVDLFPHVSGSWESRFVLILWLSVLVRSPFTFEAIGVPKSTFLAAAKTQLMSESSNRSLVKASSLLLARLFVRVDWGPWLDVDLHDLPLGSQLEVVYRTLKLSTAYLTNNEIHKIKNLLEFSTTVSVRMRKLKIGILSFCAILSSPIDALDLIGDCVDSILDSLGDRDTSVRFGVAKAIANISKSLPDVYACQLHEYLIALAPSNDCEYHTYVMLLGELVRRDYSRISKYREKIVETAILATEKNMQQIRDSGCALAWFLSRSGCAEVLKCVNPLINLALFDRDINLRRAAAAALQELIGRRGTREFSSGLEILNIIDFWSISSIEDCYTSLSLEVVKAYPLASESMISHLVNEKLFKPATQPFASRALAVLVPQCFSTTRLEGFLESMCETAVNSEREGPDRVAAIATVAHALIELSDRRFKLGETVQSQVRNLVPTIEKKRLYRGKGGDLVRTACYQLLKSIFISHDFFSFKDETKFYSKCCEMLGEGIVHLVDHVQLAAVSALAAIPSQFHSLVQAEIVAKFLERLKVKAGVNVAARRGMILALARTAATNNPEVFACLVGEALSWPCHYLQGDPDFIDPLTRQYSVSAIVRFAYANSEFTEKGVTTLLEAMEDFQTDKRGDVGSWVRMEAITGLGVLLSKSNSEQRDRIRLSLIAHSAERLDKVAKRAIEVLKTPACECPFTTICSLIELLNPQPVLISHLASAGAEKAVLNLSDSGKGKAVKALFELVNAKNRRYQSKSDFIHRGLCPAVNLLSLLAPVLDHSEFITQVHIPHIVPAVTRGFHLDLLRSVSRLYTQFLLSTERVMAEFFVNEILASPVPKARIAAAGDLIRFLVTRDEEEMVDIVDSADWLSEDETDWRNAADKIAEFIGVGISVKPPVLRKEAREPRKEIEGYREFIKETYRYS